LSYSHPLFIRSVTELYVKAEEKKGNTLVLRPKEKLPIKRTSKDPELLQKAYDLGRELAKERLDEIKEFLKS
jgi:predicted patatin/cPLA2 family phospholipase